MEKEIRVGFRATEKEKEFLQKQSVKESRTITALINLALAKQYPGYKEILEDEGKISKEEGKY